VRHETTTVFAFAVLFSVYLFQSTDITVCGSLRLSRKSVGK
jgi:hypothetical protein